MRLNILIGGKAGQGIDKFSSIISSVLSKHGYFTFNYRDYQSLIRGGHNFNIISISDRWIASHSQELDILVALDKETLEHKKQLKKDGFILSYEKFADKELGINLNIALAGALIKSLSIEKDNLLAELDELGDDAKKASELGYESQEEMIYLKPLKNKPYLLTGTQGVAQGAKNSNLGLYVAYPMTPATGVMNELSDRLFQAENEIAVANIAIGASFAGKLAMAGTSGGGFDLMSETLSLQGMSEIPLTIYLASRPGPATGVPTYTSQQDLNTALEAGHGEFPRIVIAPGDPIEAIETTNQALYLAEKFSTLSIILSDKHLASSQYALNKKAEQSLKIPIRKQLPSKDIVKATSYEHTPEGLTTEDPKLTEKGMEQRLKKAEDIRKFLKKNFNTYKLHGKKSKNLVIAWGSTKGAVLDAIQDLPARFLQVIYLKPFPEQVKKIMEKSDNLIIIENNSTAQLASLIKKETGIDIPQKNHILKYDARPFEYDKLKNEIGKRLK
ncbi:MAG: 2-oxoacid:acceptor oxidoreductase family protein [Candidatus Nanoarchaeia archaeon]